MERKGQKKAGTMRTSFGSTPLNFNQVIPFHGTHPQNNLNSLVIKHLKIKCLFQAVLSIKPNQGKSSNYFFARAQKNDRFLTKSATPLNLSSLWAFH
jgi:hypothetical protein